MMNLSSSMMSSRFYAPFLELTQKWERQMSTISEVIEVWMKVQAKWMYLEAIFVGSEDIRLQLPEEAKRFDSRIHGACKALVAHALLETTLAAASLLPPSLLSMTIQRPA